MTRVNPADARAAERAPTEAAVVVLDAEPEKHRWRTPSWLVAPLMDEFRFDLDACADETNAIARRYLSRADDALVTPWRSAWREREDVQGWGRIIRAAFQNPPWGRRGRGFAGTGAFVDRAWWESRPSTGSGLTVAVLVESATDTAWWWRAFQRADEVRIGPRVAFTRPDGTPGNSPPGGVTLFVFRPHVPELGHVQGPRARTWDEVFHFMPKRGRRIA